MDLTTRQALKEDSEFTYRVKKGVLGLYIEETWGWDEELQRDYHMKSFRPSKVKILCVADIEKIGYLELDESESNVVITGIYIVKEYQNFGIGTTVIESILNSAKKSGLPVMLSVLKVNTKAMLLYERLGFYRRGETATHITMSKSS